MTPTHGCHHVALEMGLQRARTNGFSHFPLWESSQIRQPRQQQSEFTLPSGPGFGKDRFELRADRRLQYAGILRDLFDAFSLRHAY